MSRLQHNSNELTRGFGGFKKAISDYMVESLSAAAAELLTAVVKHREFTGLTGNTQTSYACGIYVNGVCKNILMQQNWSEPPVRVKIQYGQLVFVANPYEGDPRAVRGVERLIEEFGLATSVRFLMDYGDCPREGWGLVMTTGTEYSEYLETVRGLDVLTGTAEEAATIIEKNFKAMPEG